jgi:hypothetical protein
VCRTPHFPHTLRLRWPADFIEARRPASPPIQRCAALGNIAQLMCQPASWAAVVAKCRRACTHSCMCLHACVCVCVCVCVGAYMCTCGYMRPPCLRRHLFEALTISFRASLAAQFFTSLSHALPMPLRCSSTLLPSRRCCPCWGRGRRKVGAGLGPLLDALLGSQLQSQLMLSLHLLCCCFCGW